jgi:uncharacterized protein (DUF433 family)
MTTLGDAKLPDCLVRRDDGQIVVAGHRIGLEDVVAAYQAGQGAEMIGHQFPTLPLPLIHKVIAYYLENENSVDAYVAGRLAAEDRNRAGATGPAPSREELRRRRQLGRSQAG